MIRNLLIAMVIVLAIAMAYSMGMKQDSAKVNDLKSQMDTLKSQINLQGKNFSQSYQRLHRSLDLHMAETSIEAAIHDTLDQNFGEARIAVDSARKYLKGTPGSRISPSDIEALSQDLEQASEKLAHLDKDAIKILNTADQKTRKLILKNSQ